MAFPLPATKTNCDASTDDPKQALLVDLAQLVDKFNQLLGAAAAAGPLAGSGITDAAPLNSPTFTGTVLVPNASVSGGAINLGQANALYQPVGSYQAALGYTPVQQGTGIGQSAANTVKIGWSAGSRIKATIDVTDMGNIVTDAYAFAIGQTYQDVTASRVAGTTYTNSTGKAIWVMIMISIPAGTTGTVTVDGVVRWNQFAQAAATNATATFMVVSGGTYSLSAGSVQANGWHELRT
ncbi:hypothetical protein [Sulfuriferula sp.]|uniref:hypothetical protein n=1 Tax=Sulfuriferula sp. TaxID=2025307 RepID=UPI002730AE7A|nr:hypothetical protein [Sulfuriferula sp.]MDP2026458.1 hypothetical protein [Sulfuriferula sp.]